MNTWINLERIRAADPHLADRFEGHADELLNGVAGLSAALLEARHRRLLSGSSLDCAMLLAHLARLGEQLAALMPPEETARSPPAAPGGGG